MARRLTAPILVGREAELEVLRSALEAAHATTPRTVVVGGEPGIGKSRLVAELTAQARVAGWSVHAGACPPASSGVSVPYAPFGAVLRSIVRSVDARLLDHVLGPGRRDLAALLPELGDADPVAVAAGGVARLYESVLSLVERTARRGSGLVLVLEDLHWADASARTLLAWLVQELRRVPVLLVATYRTDLLPDDPLPALLVELDRADGCERLDLGPLAAGDAARLLHALAGDALDAAQVATIARRAGGVPLYLEELASPGPAAGGPPESVRVAVTRRLAALDADGLRLVQLTAVAGRPVDAASLGLVAGLGGDAVARGSAAAIELGLLLRTPSANGGPDLLGARHALVGEAILALAPPGRAAEGHAAWASLLTARPDLGPSTPVERTAAIARHRLGAGERDAAVPALLAAADAAAAARAFATADADVARALELAGGRLAALVPDPVVVLERAARTAWLAARPARAVTLIRAAMDAAAGDPDTDAALQRRTRAAIYLAAAGRTEAAIADLEGVVAAAPAGATRTRALIELGRLLTAAGRPAEGVERGRRALTEAQAAHDRRAASRASIALGVALSAAGRHGEASEVLIEARRLEGPGLTARSDGSRSVSRLPDTLARLLDEATLLLHLGDLEGSLAAARRGRQVAQDRGLLAAFGSLVGATAAWDLVRLGRWGEADAILDGLPPAPPDDPTAGAPLAVRAWLAAARGRWSEASAALDAAPLEALMGVPGVSWIAVAAAAAALVAAGQRRAREARDRVRDGLRLLDTTGAPSTVASLALLGVMVEAEASDLARSRDDAAARAEAEDAAQELAARARSALALLEDGTDAAVPAWHAATVARLDAEVAHVAGIDDVAAWDGVVAAHEAAGDPWAAATARLRLATLLLADGGDRLRAAATVRAAVTVARALDAEPLVAAIDRLARRARLVVPSDATDAAVGGPRAAAMALGLSSREVDVLELLAAGRTDREIAEALFITEKTAGHHVSHILAKLGVSRRGEAAAMAHRIGLIAAPD